MQKTGTRCIRWLSGAEPGDVVFGDRLVQLRGLLWAESHLV
jgi:hypothetical protein